MIIEKGMEAAPTWIEGFYWIGRTLRLNGYFKESISVYNKILNLNPKADMGLFSISLIYEIKGNLDTAIYYLTEIVDRPPESIENCEQLIRCYRKKEQFDNAINVLNKRIEQSSDIYLYHLLAEVYWEKGDTASALENYKTVLKIGANDKYEKYLICLASHRLGMIDSMALCLKNDEPMDKFLFYMNSAFCAMAGEKEASLKWLEKAFANYFLDFQWAMMDRDLKNIHDTPEFKSLLKKYFPSQYKE